VKEASIVALGYDEGTVVIKLGSDYPMADFSNGKIIAAKGSQLMTYNVKILQPEEFNKGEKIHVTFKELGNADMYVQGLKFNANGQSFAIFGESDYSIYNSRSFKSAGYGAGSDLVWSKGDLFGVKLDSSIKIMKRDQDLGAFKLGYRIDAIFGGDFLAVRSDDSISFFDWETQTVIRTIEISPKDVLWNEDGTKVALISDEGVYILNCNKKSINGYLSQGEYSEGGLEAAFELENELTEIVS
jgi:coatomer subunit beta'